MSEQSQEKRGLMGGIKSFLKFGNAVPDEERLLKPFRDDLSQSERALIVLVMGPSRAGKSTLLNYLTVKQFPFLGATGGKITKKFQDVWKFEIAGGDMSCTRDFAYTKLKATEFAEMQKVTSSFIHRPDFKDFDIYFIDSEGFSNIDGASDNLYLGLFTLIGAAGVQIYIDITPTTSTDRVKHLSQNITVSNAMGNQPPRTISIKRSGTSDDNEDEDDNIEKENMKLYQNLKKQDKKNLPMFTAAVQKIARIDVNKLSILTMPNCTTAQSMHMQTP